MNKQMRNKETRKPATISRPHKKQRPIHEYWQSKPVQALEESGSCSPTELEQPTPTPARSEGDALSGSVSTANGQQIATNMLKSLQRRLVQQTLQTPYASGVISEEQSTHCDGVGSCEDFVLYSSQTYERCLSQQLQFEGVLDMSSTQDLLTQTQISIHAIEPPQSNRGSIQFPAARVSWAPCQEAEHRCTDDQVPRRVSNASNCSNRATPGNLVKAIDESTFSDAGPKLFPVFRSKKDMKVLHIIRHGESEYNAATNGPKWEDPEIFDAPLTEKGKRQAAALQNVLLSMDLPPDVLYVTSPLSRAMQTLLHAIPCMNSERCSLPNICVRSELTEKLATTGDIGRPASDLARRFPLLANQLQQLPEIWWHTHPAKPNCAITRKFLSRENKQQLQRRIAEFKKWLQNRPEKVVVAVGHSLFWREFVRGQYGAAAVDYMANCELQTLTI